MYCSSRGGCGRSGLTLLSSCEEQKRLSCELLRENEGSRAHILERSRERRNRLDYRLDRHPYSNTIGNQLRAMEKSTEVYLTKRGTCKGMKHRTNVPSNHSRSQVLLDSEESRTLIPSHLRILSGVFHIHSILHLLLLRNRVLRVEVNERRRDREDRKEEEVDRIQSSNR